MTARAIGVLVVVLLAIVPSSAHHSGATLYLLDREVAMAGVVTEFRYINPHMRLYFDVTNDAGQVEQWMAEGGTPIVLTRLGWNADVVKAGDRVKISGHPGREGAKIILWLTITLPDGRELFAEDVNFRAVDKRRQRR